MDLVINDEGIEDNPVNNLNTKKKPAEAQPEEISFPSDTMAPDTDKKNLQPYFPFAIITFSVVFLFVIFVLYPDIVTISCALTGMLFWCIALILTLTAKNRNSGHS